MTDIPLVERRKALGLSQSELATVLGVSQAAVSRSENSNSSDKRYELALEALELRRMLAPTTPTEAAA